MSLNFYSSDDKLLSPGEIIAVKAAILPNYRVTGWPDENGVPVLAGALDRGTNKYQEDRIGFAQLSVAEELTCNTLSDEEIKAVLNNIAINLNNDISTKDLGKGGSTATMALFFPAQNKVGLLNLGDSELLQIQVVNGRVKATRLHSLHTADELSEQGRVRNAGGQIVYNSGAWRLQGENGDDIAVTRSFGDKYAGKGFSREPEITVINYVPLENGKLFFCLASDGVFDNRLDEANKCITQAQATSFDKWGQRVIELMYPRFQGADKKGGVDNMSVQFFRPLSTDSHVYFGYVLDGHGGNKVSSFIDQNIQANFSKALKEVVEARATIEQQPAATFTPLLSASQGKSSENDSVPVNDAANVPAVRNRAGSR